MHHSHVQKVLVGSIHGLPHDRGVEWLLSGDFNVDQLETSMEQAIVIGSGLAWHWSLDEAEICEGTPLRATRPSGRRIDYGLGSGRLCRLEVDHTWRIADHVAVRYRIEVAAQRACCAPGGRLLGEKMVPQSAWEAAWERESLSHSTRLMSSITILLGHFSQTVRRTCWGSGAVGKPRPASWTPCKDTARGAGSVDSLGLICLRMSIRLR